MWTLRLQKSFHFLLLWKIFDVIVYNWEPCLERFREKVNNWLSSSLRKQNSKQNFGNHLKNKKTEIARNSKLREKSSRKSKSASTKLSLVLVSKLLLSVWSKKLTQSFRKCNISSAITWNYVKNWQHKMKMSF